MLTPLPKLLKMIDGGLLALLLIAIVVGVFVGTDYGMGADGFENADLGARALSTKEMLRDRERPTLGDYRGTYPLNAPRLSQRSSVFLWEAEPTK